MSLRTTPAKPGHPALLAHARERRARAENRIADAITRFAGSMIFVYVHVVWFALWIGLRVERYPYGLLTMIVSLEAIFLSTFILISQNRADDRREIVANHNWQLVREEEVQNAELIAMAKEILELTRTQHGGQAQRFPRTPPT
jgi:uncharacterized membrane protein